MREEGGQKRVRPGKDATGVRRARGKSSVNVMTNAWLIENKDIEFS